MPKLQKNRVVRGLILVGAPLVLVVIAGFAAVKARSALTLPSEDLEQAFQERSRLLAKWSQADERFRGEQLSLVERATVLRDSQRDGEPSLSCDHSTF